MQTYPLLLTDFMKSLFLVTVFFLFCGSFSIYAQRVYTWEDFIENFNEEKEDDADREAALETLYDIRQNPYEINSLTKEQLENLPFLSDRQIEAILDYTARHTVKSVDELHLLYEIDFETYQYLRFFLYAEDVREPSRFPSFKQFLQYGKRKLIVEGRFPLYWKAGNTRYSAETLAKYPNRQYAGRRFGQTTRFNWTYGQKLDVGFTADKDAGEDFFTFKNGNKGYDSYSYYLLARDINKWLKTLAVGNYRLAFGQGLVLNTDFSLGKNTLFTSPGIRGQSIKKHSSRSEDGFFRGVAATVQFTEQLQLSAFYSHIRKDANLDDEQLITSWKTDGLHRTPLEISKRGNVVNQLIGGHLQYYVKRFQLGITGEYNFFNHPFKSYNTGYRKYYSKQRNQWNLSSDYRLFLGPHSFQGEVAIDPQGSIATLNSFHLQVADAWKIVGLHRFYSYKYNAVYGRSFSEGSLVKNESGVFGGAEFTPSSRIKLTAYADVFYFPWKTYRASAGARGFELYGDGLYVFTPNFTVRGRYRFKSKEQDMKEEDKTYPLITYGKHSLRVQADGRWRNWLFKTTAHYVRGGYKGRDSKQGMLFSQSLHTTLWKEKWRFTLQGSYFDTDDYSVRVTAYESGLLYNFGFSSFYGQGYRVSGIVRYAPVASLWVMAKFGHTQYFDRRTIGSGTELSEGSSRRDLQIQIQYKF